MNSVNSVSKRLANAFVIAILVLVSLTAMTNFLAMNTANVGVVPSLAPVTGDNPIEAEDGAARGARQVDYVDLYRDISGDPQILIDNAAPGVNDIYVGEPNIDLEIPIESIKPENDNDNDGDDILYNVTIDIDETATTYYDTTTHTWTDASSYITWDVDNVSPDYKEHNDYSGNALLIEGGGLPGQGLKYIPWFYNDYGAPGFLDTSNYQVADNDEYYRIDDEYKMYDGFQFDVAGDAPVGVYNITLEINYKYQTFQNVSTQRLSAGGGNWLDPELGGGTGDLGIFDYYFWEPYNTAPPGAVDFAVPANIGFRKTAIYTEGNAAPAGATWEAIPDMGYNADDPDGYNTRAGGWAYWSNYDRDGVTSWNDGGAGTRWQVVNNWNSAGINNYATRLCDQYPYNVYDGNGTWHYSGYEGETVWEYETEYKYVEIRVEHGIRFTQGADQCQLLPDPSHPYYLKAGDQFKKMYINLDNMDFGNHLTDVYVNITLDDDTNFYVKHDWAWKDQINAGGDNNFYFRLDATNGTPVDRYSGTAEVAFDREGVRVIEYIPFEYILYYTPDLRNYIGPYSPELQVSKLIDNGQQEINVEFAVKNYGNTILENGVLTMDFSDFKHSGDEYTDPEGGEGTYSPRIEVPLLEYGSSEQPEDLSVDVEIPFHWSMEPGTYKLFMDYEGYYFNDGVLGEPTNYVKVWMSWYDDDFDSSTDMNAYCVIDSDGDEVMDIFANDETRAIDGIYMYVDVEAFDPLTPELKITDVSINGGTDTFEQGSLTNGEVSLTITNDGEMNLTNCEVELDLIGYFTGEQHYEGVNPIVENPTDYISTLNIGETAIVTLDIEGIDELLPAGIHRMVLKYSYDYDNGSLPSETSTDYGELYFNITVTDTLPDVLATVSPMTGIIRLGDKTVDINLYVNLANLEYYDLSSIEATLTVGDNTPFIPSQNTTGSGSSEVVCKYLNPAVDYIDGKGQNNNNVYFNLNLHPNAQEGTYYLDLSLNMLNENTMTEVVLPTKLEVKIYPKIARLRIIDVSISSGRVSPGKEFSLDITIQNDGGEAAREIYLEFKEAYVSGAFIEEDINPTGAKYPFSSEVIKAYIVEIQPESTGSTSFTVIGDLNIYPGVTYFQNIEFNYKDSTGGNHITTDVAPINSDTSITAKVDGENYVWDTDREAWIHEDELAAEEVINWSPWAILAVIIIWIVTLMIVFIYIIKPRYHREKQKMQGSKEPEEKPVEHEETEKELEAGDELEQEQEVIDYSEGTEETTSPYGPPPGPGASEASTAPPLAASTDKALPPAARAEDAPTEQDEDAFEEISDSEPPAAEPPVAKPANNDNDMPKKGPKKKD